MTEDDQLIQITTNPTKVNTASSKPAVGRSTRTLAFLLGCLLTTALHAAPQTGDMAPDFSLQGSDGQTHSLRELRGQGVVIAFFPKAFTGG